MRSRIFSESAPAANRRNPAHKRILAVLSIVFGLYTVTLLFPFAWMLFNSVKTKNEFFAAQWALPERVLWSNYAEIFRLFDLGSMIINSLILCIGCATVAVLSTCFASYALAKFRFRLHKVVYWMAISGLLFPIAGGLPSLYKLMQDIHLFDTHIGIILMAASGFGMNFLLMYAYMRNISDAYIEAAAIDGAGYWRTFIQIILPQTTGLTGTLWILGFIGMWNNFETTFVFLPSYQTIATGIKYIGDNITSGEYALDYPKYFAAILLTTLPMVVLFLIFQKRIMQLSLGGGIKG